MTRFKKFFTLFKVSFLISCLTLISTSGFSKNIESFPHIIYRAQIKPFLIPIEILTNEKLRTLPSIIAPQNPNTHDEIYVQGLSQNEQTYFSIYHPQETLFDPDTKENLGLYARYVGKAQLRERGNPARLVVTQAQNEIQIGDRLIPVDNINNQISDTFTLHPPSQFIKSRILTVVNRGTLIGQYDVVAINSGNTAHLREGNLLNIYSTQAIKTSPKQPLSESIGKLMIFKTSEKISWGFILSATLPIRVGDIVSTPKHPNNLLKQALYHV